MTTTYVIIADSSQAKLFEYDKQMSSLTQLRTLDHPEGRLQDHELDSDRDGRQANGAIGGSHGYGGDKSSQRHEVEVFAAHVAQHLEQERNAGHFQHLILIAPPQFLGNLRKELTTDCERLVTMEINKNLVSERAEVIIARLQDQDNDAATE